MRAICLSKKYSSQRGERKRRIRTLPGKESAERLDRLKGANRDPFLRDLRGRQRVSRREEAGGLWSAARWRAGKREHPQEGGRA